MVVKIKSKRYEKISTSSLPAVKSRCFELLCSYNDSCSCDNPRGNKSSKELGEAICSLWANKRLLDSLTIIEV